MNLNRDDAFVFLRAAVLIVAGLVLMASAVAADPPRLPPGVTCADVRAKVAEHGEVYAYAWARLRGYSKAQINEAKRCLRN